MNIKNQNVLITGGASGIGKLMVIEMAKKGAKKYCCLGCKSRQLK